ncbi:hypothetical protein AQ808_18610 [Burkholderia pseudomallei]|nr:hypothetical protein AQ808_18610 [Burkholderia pseudomallei]OMZ61997.1 hypothetical protein AQ865_06920 [Burkholderia pseudomallei]
MLAMRRATIGPASTRASVAFWPCFGDVPAAPVRAGGPHRTNRPARAVCARSRPDAPRGWRSA